MDPNLEQITCRILREYRHLLTESERRADRAFYCQARIDRGVPPEGLEPLIAARDEALLDPVADEFFRRGRDWFLEQIARRVLAEHGESLPKCPACGQPLRTPNPKHCFGCDYC